jgi:hypothetical protein
MRPCRGRVPDRLACRVAQSDARGAGARKSRSRGRSAIRRTRGENAFSVAGARRRRRSNSAESDLHRGDYTLLSGAKSIRPRRSRSISRGTGLPARVARRRVGAHPSQASDSRWPFGDHTILAEPATRRAHWSDSPSHADVWHGVGDSAAASVRCKQLDPRRRSPETAGRRRSVLSHSSSSGSELAADHKNGV